MDKTREEVLEKRKAINKKILVFGFLPIIAIFILVAVISPKESAKGNNSKAITGLMPVDVYLNLEKEGFKTDKIFNGENGNVWASSKSIAGIDYTVETFSYDVNNVERVKATAMIDVATKSIIATKQFLLFVATLPYEKAKPQEAASWIDRNFDNNKVDTIIGDAKFTIIAPSIALRMLTIEKK